METVSMRIMLTQDVEQMVRLVGLLTTTTPDQVVIRALARDLPRQVRELMSERLQAQK